MFSVRHLHCFNQLDLVMGVFPICILRLRFNFLCASMHFLKPATNNQNCGVHPKRWIKCGGWDPHLILPAKTCPSYAWREFESLQDCGTLAQAEILGRSSPTPLTQIRRHNKAVEISEFCPACRRFKSKYKGQIASREQSYCS